MTKQFKSATELKQEMLESVIRVMTGFQKDVVIDFERTDQLASSESDDWFYWGVRKMGTHTRETSTKFDQLVADWGENEFEIKALIGRSVKNGYLEIFYTKHPDLKYDENGNKFEL